MARRLPHAQAAGRTAPRAARAPLRYGARKSQYIGSDKTRVQASWAAALVNLNPIGHHLATGTA